MVAGLAGVWWQVYGGRRVWWQVYGGGRCMVVADVWWQVYGGRRKMAGAYGGRCMVAGVWRKVLIMVAGVDYGGRR